MAKAISMIRKSIADLSSRECFIAFERKYSMNSFDNASVVRLLVVKLRVLLEWLFRVLSTNPVHNIRVLTATAALKNTRAKKEALVLGNGPSVKDLNIDNVLLSIVKDELDLYVVNYFPISDFGKIISGRYVLVLSDPEHKPNSDNPRVIDLWHQIESEASISLVLPSTWAPTMKTLKLPNKVHYFNDTSLQGISRNINPLFPRGYSTLTAYKALAFALYRGYKKLYVLGIDNTMYRTLRVDEKNNLLQDSNHIPGSQNYTGLNLSRHYPGGTSDYFHDLALVFSDLKRAFFDDRIINLDKNSMVDAFRKVENGHNFLSKS